MGRSTSLRPGAAMLSDILVLPVERAGVQASTKWAGLVLGCTWLRAGQRTTAGRPSRPVPPEHGSCLAGHLRKRLCGLFIPDVLLTPMAVASRRRFYVPLGAAIAGSALGGAALSLAATLLPDQVNTLQRLLPLVSERQIAGCSDKPGSMGRCGISGLAVE